LRGKRLTLRDGRKSGRGRATFRTAARVLHSGRGEVVVDYGRRALTVMAKV